MIKTLLAATCLAAMAMPALAAAVDKATGRAADPAILWNWTGPYEGLPPFDKADPKLFSPAFVTALAARQAEIDAITANPAPATFENTIAALERSGQKLDRVGSIFSVMTSNVSNDSWEALDKEWSPKFAVADDKISFDDKLFTRIAAVNANPAGLTPEQVRLTKRYYDQYVRAGARLDAKGKAELGRINERLAALFSDFSAKLLADENTWTVIDSEASLAGVPAATIATYKAAADKRGSPGKIFVVNTRSAVDPLLTFATDRAVREKVWKTFVARGDNGDKNDTNAVITEIVKLRAERAKLLGFATHADWRMQDTMAKTPAAANALMLRVWPAAIARVGEEVADMQKIADAEGARITIAPWDYRFYAEKVRKARYDLDQAELKPYFELNNIIDASYWAAEKLYGFTFKEVTGTVPVFAPNVRVWEVRDGKRGFVGLFYRDDFARAGKRSGAWMTSYRTPSTFDGPVTILGSNNNNFTESPKGEPVLISLDDARTLFHEFGHALHFLSIQQTYPGHGMPRDFVEYPSQFNEHWVLTPEVLDKFARHYKTGAAMPQALIDKVQASDKFNQGFAVTEYLSSALVDMALHTTPDGVVDPDKFERETLAALKMPPQLVMRHRLPQFGHLFSSDSYSAGYYSYLWSEVMDADTWAAFAESKVPWDPEIAKRYKDVILATGNTSDRGAAFRKFRGRDPEVKAYLEKRGFPVK
ncbi:M3 family metallopeptidase [Polymorphobacter fuscus]|uniref:M3 family peptidase n=1 Tax=Sandarakinorhabdus fusca TaxID=1439888 RepID=A0A7C9KWC5_9SPHN|nr:M3 family metallopeptidase [Polymorphobacter fuscus]KAB7647595.1 M3 family metallopeptidase [Polymorphobacter fuscus]MQT16865.1 M3 family peptidase [Polymorphobacter fuscus]NJC09146.1 peptidyl-dipeptidase Dcp [Polymorphobacter fuscus]